jgi:hypothetical protein
MFVLKSQRNWTLCQSTYSVVRIESDFDTESAGTSTGLSPVDDVASSLNTAFLPSASEVLASVFVGSNSDLFDDDFR